MDVPVCLLAAEAEYVQALGWYDGADRLANSMDDDLQIEVLVQAEVAGDLLAVLLGSDENVSVQRLIALKERDRPQLTDLPVAEHGCRLAQQATELLDRHRLHVVLVQVGLDPTPRASASA
jgi:hypothetical protein